MSDLSEELRAELEPLIERLKGKHRAAAQLHLKRIGQFYAEGLRTGDWPRANKAISFEMASLDSIASTIASEAETTAARMRDALFSFALKLLSAALQ